MPMTLILMIRDRVYSVMGVRNNSVPSSDGPFVVLLLPKGRGCASAITWRHGDSQFPEGRT